MDRVSFFGWEEIGYYKDLSVKIKTNRHCNVCNQFLKEDSPNWFQCSEDCRRIKWAETEEKIRKEKEFEEYNECYETR